MGFASTNPLVDFIRYKYLETHRDGIGTLNVRVNRWTRAVVDILFMPDLPDQVLYLVDPAIIPQILSATDAAMAVGIIRNWQEVLATKEAQDSEPVRADGDGVADAGA